MPTARPWPPAAALPSAALQAALPWLSTRPESFPCRRTLPLAFPALHLEEGIGERHCLYVGRQVCVDDERDRHALDLPRRERLLRETEAFELLEMARRQLRSVARDRLAGNRAAGVIADLEHSERELSGMDAHALLDGREGPRQVAAQVRVELNREQPRRIYLAPWRRIGPEHAVKAQCFAQHAVERHHRETEAEHDHSDDEKLQQHLLVRPDASSRIAFRFAYHGQCRITTPTKKAIAIDARMSAVLALLVTFVSSRKSPFPLPYFTTGGVSKL